MQHSNAILLRSIFLLGMICCMLSSLSAIDQWTTMPMQSVNTMQTGVRPIYTTTGSLRRGMLSAAPVTRMGSTSTYSPATSCYSGRSTTVLGRNAEITLHNINASTPVMRRLGGGDNDDDDDWGDDPGSGAGGGSSGQPEASVGTVMILLLFAGIYFAVQVRRKRKKDQAANQTINQHPETQQPQSQTTSKIKTSRLMKKVAAILFLIITSLSIFAGKNDWYLYFYSTTYSLNGDAGQFTSSGANTYTLSSVSVPGSGINFCVHNTKPAGGWDDVYGWKDASVTTVGVTYGLATANSATGWLAIPAGIYNVTFNSSDLTIRFDAIYTVSYSKGTPAASISGTAPTSTTVLSGEAETAPGAVFTREGYTQTGWATSDGGTKAYELGAEIYVYSDLTLYPYWSINRYSIVYNKGTYGIGMIASQSKTYGVNVTLSDQKFSRAGYIQTGWSTTDGGAKVYNLGATYTANADVILYPYWEEDTSTKYYLRGTMFDSDPWGTTVGQMINNGNDIYSLSIYLDIEGTDWVKNFQIYCPSTGKWWELTYDYALTFDATQVTLTEGGTSRNASRDANLRACESATYTFTFNPANGQLNVTFPPTRYYLSGTGDLLYNWAPDGIEFMGTGTTRIAYLNVPYAESNHSFKITKLNGYCDTYTWYGNGGTIDASTTTPWSFTTDGTNCTFNPECAGTYKFILDISTPATPKLSVEFPEGNANQYYVTGSWCDWELRDEYLLESVNDKVYIPLAASTSYTFYLVNSCSGRTYSHATAVTNTINNRTYSESAAPCTLTTAAAGEYVFELKATTPQISIYYPEQSNYYLAGSFNSWATNNAAYRFSKNSNGSNKYVLGAPLPGCEYHEMKVVNGSTWYGDKTYTTAHIMYSVNNWQASSDGSNWGITTQKADIYRFTFDTDANPQTLSVAYPSPYYALMGTFNNWSRCSHVFPDNAIITAELAANTEYRMQIISAEGLWGIERYSGLESPTHLVVSSEYNVATTRGTVEDPNGFAMVTTVAGTYSFAFDYTTHQLTIIYPDVELINLCLGSSYELPHGYTYSGDIAYVHENRFYGTEYGQYTVEGVNQADLSHVAYTFAVGDCPYDYRIQSVTTYGTFYSNIVGTTGDSLSLYVHPSGACYWQRSDHGADSWTTGINNLQSGKSISESGIYHTIFTGLEDGTDITGSWKRYNGDLYVYDATPSLVTKFEEITPNRDNLNEFFDHTIVMRGTNSKATMGVTMGDEINTCISYADGRYTAQTAEGWDFARYIYNASDNHFQRNILKLGNAKYLYVNGSNPSKDHNDFTYIGDNKFEADFTANQNCNIKLIAKNGDNMQYLLYKTASSSDVLNVSGTMTSSFTMDMHIYYDFRTNKILQGWMPSNYSSSGSANTIDANLLIKRVNNTAPTAFASNHNRQITIARKTYFIQEFTSALSSSLADSYFYLSLPFAASMSDVFGMDDLEYKTNYTVQRYRGDRRAQYGDAYMDSPGYWANMNRTASLEAGRGYEIGIYDIPYPVTGSGEAASPSTRRLVFPSTSTGFVVKAPKNYPSTVIAANAAGSGIDEAAHANWNVVGTPGLIAVTPYASTTFSFTGLNGNTSPNYLYTWNGEYNDFTVQNYQTFTFQPMMSYFMQYVGTIQWGSASTPAAVRARAPKSGDRVICDLYEVSLSNTYGEEEDKTYVSFSSDGANTFEQHRDLYKIPTANHAQIYSAGVLSETKNNAFAAQDVERDVVVEVPLTLTLENGEYTISLTNVLTTEAIPTPLYLYDAETDTRACITDGQTYTFHSNGTVIGRFFLRLYTSDGHNVATDLESVEENQNSVLNVKYIRNGKLYIHHDGNTYDATGLRL